MAGTGTLLQVVGTPEIRGDGHFQKHASKESLILTTTLFFKNWRKITHVGSSGKGEHVCRPNRIKESMCLSAAGTGRRTPL